MDRRAVGDEARARVPLGDVVVLLVGQRLEIVGAGLDRGRLQVGAGSG